jgi:hypothetical protein
MADAPQTTNPQTDVAESGIVSSGGFGWLNPEAIKKLPWWRKDKYGWPIETVKDHLIKSWVRILCQNIRKITG